MDYEKIGNNIRSLRNYYGETQEELGALLYVEKNTISQYENAKRKPSRELLKSIASYYMVSEDMLINDDLSKLNKLVNNGSIGLKYYSYFCPVISNAKAERIEPFKRAVALQKQFYLEIERQNFKSVDLLYESMDYYCEALSFQESQCEAEENLLGIMVLQCLFLSSASIMDQGFVIDKTVKETLKQLNMKSDFSFAQDPQYIKDSEEYKSLVKETLKEMRLEAIHGDIVHYYLALTYALGMDGDSKFYGKKREFGFEMMRALSSIGNPYAKQYLLACRKMAFQD